MLHVAIRFRSSLCQKRTLSKYRLSAFRSYNPQSSLVCSNCGQTDCARQADRYPWLTSRAPAAEIQSLCEKEQWGRALDVLFQYEGVCTDLPCDAYIYLLRALSKAKSLHQIKQMHAHLARWKPELIGSLGEELVIALVTCGALDDAHCIFVTLPQCTVFSCTAMISGYAERGHGWKALKMHCYMQEHRLEPNEYTFVSLLKACASISNLEETEKLHAEACMKGFSSDVFVGNTLVSVYSKCRCTKEAESVFRGLCRRDIVSWNSMLSAYVEQDKWEAAFRLYRQMHNEGVNSNQETCLVVLRACGALMDKGEAVGLDKQAVKVMSLEVGRALHAEAERKKFSSSVVLGSSFVRFYGKCGSIIEAENVFYRLVEHDLVSWNAILLAYVEHGQGVQVWQLYVLMHEEGMSSDQQSVVISLQACVALAKEEEYAVEKKEPTVFLPLEIGRALHGDAIRKGLFSNVHVVSSLVNMYGKCRSISESEGIFGEALYIDAVLWNAMLSTYIATGQEDKVYKLYRQMKEEGLAADQQTFMIMFQACSNFIQRGQTLGMERQPTRLFLEVGEALHADVRKNGFISDVSLCNALANMYGRCGHIVEAESVIDGLLKRNVASWGTLLSLYVEFGHEQKALQAYQGMQEQGISPNRHIFVIVLQGCSILLHKVTSVYDVAQPVMDIVQALHTDAWRKGLISNAFVVNTFVNMFGKCGSIEDAEDVFEAFAERDIVSWNAMLSAYVEQGLGSQALQLYRQMQEEGVSSNLQTTLIVIQACCAIVGKEENIGREGVSSSKLVAFEIGKALHANARRKGLNSNVMVGSVLVSLYGKCGSIVEAENVFHGLLEFDIVSWSAMLSAYLEQGQGEKSLQLYCQLHEEGLSSSKEVVLTAVQACCSLLEKGNATSEEDLAVKGKSLKIGRALHTDAERNSFIANSSVGNALVGMYGKYGSILEGENIFTKLPQRDTVSWNVMLLAYYEQGQGEKTLLLFRQMQEEGACSRQQTLVLTLQSCGTLLEAGGVDGHNTETNVLLEIVRALHALVRRKGFSSDTFVMNSLVTTYGKCGRLAEAENLFNELLKSDVVSWTALLSAYAEHAQGEKALLLYKQMHLEGVSPNQRTLAGAVAACGALFGEKEHVLTEQQLSSFMALEVGRTLHVDARSNGFDIDEYVGSTFVSMYGKLGSIEEARNTFNGLVLRNTVLWSVMLSVYLDQGEGEEATHLFKQLQEEDVRLDDIVVMYALQACSETGNAEVCMQLHFSIVFMGCDFNHLLSTVIRAYGSCGSVADAQAVLDGMPSPDIVSWNACIAGYAQAGDSVASLETFYTLQLAGFVPTEVTFLSVLCSCCHSSVIAQGVICFESMIRSYSITPNPKHYVMMMDMLWRAGDFGKVEGMLLGMPMHADVVGLLCLLGACRVHGSVELGKQAFDYATSVKPTQTALYVLMSNMYADGRFQATLDELG